LTIVQCYAPTNEAGIEEKEAFYGLLEATLHQIRQSDIIIMKGDFNAKIGDDNQGQKHVMADTVWAIDMKMGYIIRFMCEL